MRIAVAFHGRAVDLSEIRDVLRAHPHLALPENWPVSAAVGSLAARGRVVRLRRSTEARRRLYTLPRLTRRLPSDEATVVGVARLAIRRFVRARGAQPFTTKAMRLYAEGTCGLTMKSTDPMRWTNALGHLEDLHEVVRVGMMARFVAWADAQAWNRARPLERRRLRRAVRERESESGAPSVSARARRRDPLFLSDAHDTARVCEVARRLRNRKIRSASERKIVCTRPLTMLDLLAALRLTDADESARESFRRLIHDAVRHTTIRGGTGIRYAGRVSGESYFHVSDRDGQPFTDFLLACEAADNTLASREFLELQRVADHANATPNNSPAAKAVRRARALRFAYVLHVRREQLGYARGATQLLPQERAMATALLKRLARAAQTCEHLAGGSLEAAIASYDLSTLIPTSGEYFVLADAAHRLEKQLGVRIGSSLYTSRQVEAFELSTSARPKHASARGTSVDGTRPARLVVARLTYLFAVIRRFGGPTWRATAIAAEGVYGALCSSDVAVRAARLQSPRTFKLALIGVLSIADDAASAIAIHDILKAELLACAPDAAVLEALIFGLLRTPLAGRRTHLEKENVVLLDRARLRVKDKRVRMIATLVLRSWSEAWSDHRVLSL
jgi:hypothetical protein